MVNDNLDIIKDISFYTQVPEERIKDFVLQSASNRNPYYKHKAITKKDGKLRHIFMPTAELKHVQHFIVHKYLSKYPISKHATAYVRGKSLIDNIRPHLSNSHFLFIDIKHFFDSIDFSILLHKMSSKEVAGQSLEAINKMLKICSKNYCFVQGNVSSPLISNIFMKDFDDKMERLVGKLDNGVYTRYSDDIVVSSSNKIPSEILMQIDTWIKEEKLQINTRKTRFSSYIEKIKITGIRVRNDRKPSLDTNFKKRLKNRVYHYLKYGKSSKENPEQLLGLLSYLKMVDLPYFNKLNYKYTKNNLLLTGYLKTKIKKEIS